MVNIKYKLKSGTRLTKNYVFDIDERGKITKIQKNNKKITSIETIIGKSVDW